MWVPEGFKLAMRVPTGSTGVILSLGTGTEYSCLGKGAISMVNFSLSKTLQDGKLNLFQSC